MMPAAAVEVGRLFTWQGFLSPAGGWHCGWLLPRPNLFLAYFVLGPQRLRVWLWSETWFFAGWFSLYMSVQQRC